MGEIIQMIIWKEQKNLKEKNTILGVIDNPCVSD